MASAEVGLPSIQPGQVVTFKGYADSAVAPIFQPGEQVRIESVDPLDNAMRALRLDGTTFDTIYPDEIELPEVAEPEVSLKVAAASAKIARKTDKPKVKAKAKAPAPVKAKKAEPKKVEPKKAIKRIEPKAKSAVTRDAKTVDFVDEARAGELAAKVETTPAETPTANVPAIAPMATGVRTEGGAVSDSERVASILAAQDALQAAKDLVAQAEETYFTLGGVLSHIYYEGIHKTLGYDGKRGFEAYVEKELGVAYRKAMYLIDIYTTFRKVGFDERRLTQIGWSKAKELTRFVTEENVEELVAAATDKSREELVTHLRETVAQAEGGTAAEQARRVKIGFALFADQAETVTRALDVAKEKVGNDNINQALEYICAEWLMMAEGVATTLEDDLRHLQAKHGVRLVPQSAAEAEEPAEVAA